MLQLIWLPSRFKCPQEAPLRYHVLEAFVVELNAEAGRIWNRDSSVHDPIPGHIKSQHGGLVPLHEAEPVNGASEMTSHVITIMSAIMVWC